jgi:hypothetical protein
MHAKIQSIIKYRYLQTIILVSECLQFCTRNYCIKVRLVKPTVQSGSRVFIQNFVCNFWTLLQVFMNFGSLQSFLGIKTIENNLKSTAQCWADIQPMAAAFGRGSLWTGCAVARSLPDPRSRRRGMPRSGMRLQRPD